MGKLESLEKGVKIWTGAEKAMKQRMIDFRAKHKASWWFRPAYWKIEKQHHKLFLELINYRIKYATALKESGK